MKKEAPTTPRGKNSNETLNDRPVLSHHPHMLTHVSTHEWAKTNSPCGNSGLQVSELIPRLGCIQSDRGQDAPPARPQPNAGEAATQSQPKHQPQKTTCQTVQLVSTHRLWLLLKGRASWAALEPLWVGKLHSSNEYSTEHLKQKRRYLLSLKITFCWEQSAGHVSHSVSLNLLLVSNHEDEDNLPEALAAISSQSTAKSGSSSSLDKQIQPSIYPQVTHTHT